jgi:hypothetical protein
MNRTLLIILIVLLTIGFSVTAYAWWEQKQSNAQLDLYNRQLEGHLSEKEVELQSLNTELGTTRSKLLDFKALSDDHDKILNEILRSKDREFAEFRKRHNLRIESYTKAIFELQQEIDTQNSSSSIAVVDENGNPIATDGTRLLNPAKDLLTYAYTEKYGRITLVIPNVFKPGAEKLTLKQKYRVFGDIYTQPDDEGFLKAQRIVLQEIVEEDGKVKVIHEAELKDAEFKYLAEKPDADPCESWRGWGKLLDPQCLFEFNILASLGTNFEGAGVVGLGGTILKHKIGSQSLYLASGVHTSTESLEHAGFHLKLLYRPYFIHKDANFGLGAGVSFPFNDLGGVQFMLDANFFVW